MIRMRRWASLVALGILGLALADRAAGQMILQPQPGVQPNASGNGGNSAGHSSVKIFEDAKRRKAIEVGSDLIKEKIWSEAVVLLQTVLKDPKDHYVQVREQDPNDPKKETTRWTSVKFEANNLIGSMPVNGLEAYELAYGADAKTALDEAKKTGDRDLLADVAQKYCHTKAGIQANEIMATLFLARGQVFTAALRFDNLLSMNPEWTKPSDLTLFKAAIAFHRAGDKRRYDDAWKRLENLPGIKVGEEYIPMAKLEAVIKETPIVDFVNVYDWPSVRGNNTNTAQAMGSPPLLDTRLWVRKLYGDKLDGFDDTDDDLVVEPRLRTALKQANDANLAVLPGFFPIASQGIMVYRSYLDVRAVALKDREDRDPETGKLYKTKAGEILWKSLPYDRSLANMLKKQLRIKTDQWLDAYEKVVPGFTSFLYDNTVIGTLATDHRFVYAINDLAVPPHPNAFVQQFGFNPQMQNFSLGDMKPLVIQNELWAYNLSNGKIRWDLNATDPQFKDSHFLSLPISVGGKLYLLNERLINPTEATGPNMWGGMGNPIGGESELRLVCLDPNKLVYVEKSVKPEVLEIQVLGNVLQHNRFVQDMGRRVNVVHLAYGEGVLVCPTNAGEVFGIDLMTRSLVWSYPYRETAYQQIQLPGMQFQQPNPFGVRPQTFGTTTTLSKWKSSPPAIQDGKIVFTAPDADSIHCVNLRDGKAIWKKAQSKGDLYMAGVYQGRVLVVGEGSIRAHDLRTGDRVWTVPTGDLPSGQGVASKGIYYLPLKRGEILAIDIPTGQVKAHNRAAVAGAAPGNLVFYEGMVLSQTPTEVMAYPQLSARLESAKTDLGADPENQKKLTDYGDLLLKDGQVQVAVDILMKVFDRKPPDPLGKRVRERLFEALTDLAQADFAKVSTDYLPVYKSLCDVPGDNVTEQNRKAKFFRIVGQGREAQGNLVEAFQMYKDFGSLPLHRDQGIATPEDPTHKIPVNVWLRGRISGMMAKASPIQREPLEAKISEEWEVVKAKKDIEAIRSFVGMFDIPVRVGREARIRLAETIMERNERGSFLEAELFLYQVMGSDFRTDPQAGGRALAALAQLEEKKGTIDSMRLAAAYYRELGRDFGRDAVRGSKTGSDLFNDLATDKRFLPFLEDVTNPWGPAKIAARELTPGTFSTGVPGFAMQPDGDQTPFAKQHRLVLDPSNPNQPRLRLRDITTNQDRWTLTLPHVQMNVQLFFNLYQQANVSQAYYPNARFRFYHVKGHLLVCQVGVMVYCIDGDTGKKLWEMQTVENMQQNGLIHLQQVMNDQEGNPEFLFWNQMNNQRFRVTLGRIGAVQASYVAILGHKGLSVVDPLKGTPLWKKTDVAMNSHLFGDDQYLFLADATENGSIGAGRTMRANDGEVLNFVPDFSGVYQARVRVLGRRILAVQHINNSFTMRLYDILSGKDVWTKAFPIGSTVLQTEDPNLTGVIDPKGNVTVLDAGTGKELLQSNVIQHRITAEDVKGLKEPMLLGDSDRFYLALNRPIDSGKVGGGLIHNNFNSATRCQVVNGWFLALHRHDGKRKTAGGEIAWKKGDLAWHLIKPMSNQMIVLEQFELSPIIIFSARYNEIMGAGNRWVSVTHSVSKTTGAWIYDSKPQLINGASPMYNTFLMDLKSRTINLIGYNGAVQHYINDGKAPPPIPQQGAMLAPGSGFTDGMSSTIILGNVPPNGGVPVIRRVIADPPIQVVPLPVKK